MVDKDKTVVKSDGLQKRCNKCWVEKETVNKAHNIRFFSP